MKYFYDSEFLEGKQTRRFFGIPVGKTPPTIDLISIALIAEDGREYYAISKDFNLKEAWSRREENLPAIHGDPPIVNYWIRENVLRPIHAYLRDQVGIYGKTYHQELFWEFTYKSMKNLLRWYGKTNKEIAAEIFDFVNPDLGFHISSYNNSELGPGGRLFPHFEAHNVTALNNHFYAQPEFYGYYADYDHVVLSWLYNRMIDLPPGFPKYTIDIKQMMDDIARDISVHDSIRLASEPGMTKNRLFEERKSGLKDLAPKQPEAIHDAREDARYHKALYDFIQSL